MELNNFKSFKTGSRRVSKASAGDWIHDHIGEPDVAPAPKATINQSFLESLVGLPGDDAAESIKEKGFQAVILEHGTAVAQCLWPDTIHVWLNEDNFTVSSATAGDSSQVISDV